MPSFPKSLERGHKSVRHSVSDAEWQVRVDLAAAYRLVAERGWDDLIYSHLSARVPGEDGHFLINPFGQYFDEITASSLVKVNLDCEKVLDSPYAVNPSGFVLIQSVFRVRKDVGCVIHLHTPITVAVATQKHGLLPVTQNAITFEGRIAYHEYEGPAVTPDEVGRLGDDLGDKAVMMLRSHGCLIVGSNVADTFAMAHDLHRACEMQIALLSAGLANIHEPSARSRELVREKMAIPATKFPEWPGLIRRLARSGSDHDT
jgi:ribulose-5-phosphate 4-epimerase/fuculose-1-phosphate aldolase